VLTFHHVTIKLNHNIMLLRPNHAFSGVFFAHSFHVETVILMTKCGYDTKKQNLITTYSGS